jgi:hypothetical protein
MASLALLIFALAIWLGPELEHYGEQNLSELVKRIFRTENPILLVFYVALSLTGMLWVIWLLLTYIPGAVIGLYVFTSFSCSVLFFRTIESMLKLQLHWFYPIVLGALIGPLWLVWPSWFTYDLVGILVAAIATAVMRPGLMPIAYAVMAGVVCYDVVNVFGTGLMQKVALGMEHHTILPALFIAPRDSLWFTSDLFKNSSGILGLGDIVFPGWLVIEAYRRGFLLGVLAGYMIGLFMAFAVAWSYHKAMPATLFIIPMVWLTFFFGDYRKKTAAVA